MSDIPKKTWIETDIALTEALLSGVFGKQQPVHYQDKKRRQEMHDLAVKDVAKRWGMSTINDLDGQYLVGQGVVRVD
jgi:hypothetical protein